MTSKDYQAALSSALASRGNNHRVIKALNKKGDINVAFVGGSISKGSDGKTILKDNYTTLLFNELTAAYPHRNFVYNNFSTESANSFLGLSIASKRAEEADLDIVFVEYAVNNECSQEHIISYESLVYRLMSLPSSPAVILVFMINQSMYTSQGYMKKIGEHYGLPMISVADSLKVMLENGKLDWTVYSDDWIHPNGWGHKFIADCIGYYFSTLDLNSQDEPCEVDKPVYSLDFSAYRPVAPDSGNVESEGFEHSTAGEFFTDVLNYTKDVIDPYVKFEADFKNLFISYVHDKTDRFSDADVYVDGRKTAVLQGKSIYGWGNVVLKRVHGFRDSGHHTVELRLKDKKKDFVFVEFGIC